MNTARFSKYVWPFFIIMHERLRRIQNLLENLKFKRVKGIRPSNHAFYSYLQK